MLTYSKFGLKSASGYLCWRELWEDVRSEEHIASLGNVADGIENMMQSESHKERVSISSAGTGRINSRFMVLSYTGCS